VFSSSDKRKLSEIVFVRFPPNGEGHAHIFDYKTKELGKRMFWDWKGGTNRKVV
jgi:hypothetical protein